jgi:hypothetical protein
MNIPLFIPYVNRLDLLEKAVNSVSVHGDEVVVINNSGGNVPCSIGCSVMRPSVPLTASQTLNWMQYLAKLWDCPFYFFMHNDAEAHPGTFDKLLEMAWSKQNSGDNWAVIFTHYDTLAAYKTSAFDAIGPWDTNFSQYFTDNDMYRRLRLAGYELAESCLPVDHVGSQTIHSDPVRGLFNSITFPIHERYYVAKWGGRPNEEAYTVPFNGVMG